jgi:hypothetical protein
MITGANQMARKSKYQEGDYFGIVGAYFGIAFLNGKWHKYECGNCMRAQGLLKNRLSNGDNPRLISMFNSRKYEFRHDKDLHNKFLEKKSKGFS